MNDYEEMCIKIIALFVHNQITAEEFADLLFANTELFTYFFFDNTGKNIFGEKLHYDIIDTNFNVKEQCISIKTKLADFLKKKYPQVYDSISDSYVEKIVEENNDDMLTRILAKRYIQPELVVIDFSGVDSSEKFILKVRDSLGFPISCTNWHAVNDMIYDVMFPKKIIFENCDNVRDILDWDFSVLKEILDKKSKFASSDSDFEIEYI